LEKIIFFTYQKCTTCRKAKKWLDDNFIEYELVDIVVNPPSREILSQIINNLSNEKRKIFNTRGKSFRDLKLVNLSDYDDEAIINLLRNDGKLIKRPILKLNNKEFLLGFNEADYKKNFLNNN
tara:strand:+ start:294 stop:662 length:369 start_codon:yes stop_codon:yes gene_type:complete